MKRGAGIKSAVVLDTSAAISWTFKDERDAISVAMAGEVTESGAVVPPLFRWELQNALLTAVRHQRISMQQANYQLEAIDALDLQVDNVILSMPMSSGLGLADRFNLSAYDAAYLELAVRRSLPIMTRDRRLMSAARDLQILWNPS